MRTAYHLIADTRAASAAEYALILAIVGTGIAAAAAILGHSISCSLQKGGAIIESNGQSSDPNYGNSDPSGNAYGQRKRC